ncbi:acetyl-CoA carboxylase biotin carboxyl carrier protein [bacterium]|nr:MAG: acetyl-CoA carboxylase biotin carboxyl carrier protein [bacterium]RKZ18182.1 MAG: acetyl-CoA carboxylase biotin carboxyl carrier protein [bacterium]
MDMDKIRELIRLVQESEIQEIELSQRGETIRISRALPAVAPPAPLPAMPAPAAAAVPPAAAPAEPAPVASGLYEVISPIVGTYYSAPSPESAPFVEVGQRVTAGDVLCIIEAMKVMNEIEAEVSGTVREATMSSGQPVEFGQVLFRIDEG